MIRHETCNFPKMFMYYNQKLHFVLTEFVKWLNFDKEEYAPILSVLYNGNLKYEMVTPYNQKWLPRTADTTPIPEDKRVSFDPAPVWTEDRWIFCRRMSGDDICQILFYKLATFIWGKNRLNAHQMHAHQVSLLTSVFKVPSVRDFMDKLDQPVQVTTWDGKELVWMTADQIDKMHKETCLLGPMAAMFGREVQQVLMYPNPPKLISVEDFQYSVNSGRASLSQQRIAEARVEPADDHRDDDQVSHSSKRTRSPRKPFYSDIRSQHSEPRVPDLRPNSSYPREADLEQEGRYYNPSEPRRR